MTMRLAVVVSSVLLLVLLTPFAVPAAYAKYPIHDADHTFGLFLRMMIFPAAAASGGLVLIALYIRQK